MGNKKLVPLEHFLLLRNLGGLLFVFLTIYIVFFSYILNEFEFKLKDRRFNAQKLLTENISNEILIGLDAKVYDRCKLILKDEEVVGVKIERENSFVICDLVKDISGSNYSLRTAVFFDEEKSSRAADVKIQYSTALIQTVRNRFLLLLGFAFSVFVGLSIFIVAKIRKGFSLPLMQMSLFFKDLKTGNSLPFPIIDSNISEVAEIAESSKRMLANIELYESQLIKLTTAATFSEVARQVAHDIRSPLSALNIVQQSVDNLPSNVRDLIKASVARINGIADDLLRGKSPLVKNEKIESILNLAEEVVSEKKIEYQNLHNVSIELVADSSLEFNFNISKVDFSRVLSNLINNAVEALPNASGKIEIKLSGNKDFIRISVVDNGVGISEDNLGLVGKKGISLKDQPGKTSGSGLGLYNARCVVENVGGHLSVESKLGVGTTVSIVLPRK